MRNAGLFLAAATLVAAAAGVVWATGLASNGDSDRRAGTATTPAVLAGSSPPPASGSTTTTRPAPTPVGTPVTAPFELPIFMYHHISPAFPADQLTANLTVLTSDFEVQLAYLKCAGYTGITMRQLFDHISAGAALPAHPVILTFDDGYDDAYTGAFPLLRKYGFMGSFAIITGFVEGGGPYLSWAQIMAMAGAGMEMMSHSASHPDLGTSGDATVRDQISVSKAALEQHLGGKIEFLVYPSGEPFRSNTVERQQQVVQMLKAAGYRGALLAGPNSVTQDPATPFALSRVRVSGGESLATYAGSIGGPSPGSLHC